MPPAPVSRHLAYVSYAEEDNRGPGQPWGNWVAEVIETFPVPRSLVGRPTPFGPIPARLTPIIKAERRPGDETLAASARQAVEQSRLLIVVCSPAAARSAAVAEEIRAFKQLGRDRVIALIVAGEPYSGDAATECFPDTLKYEVRRDGSLDREWRVHPIVIDARPGRGSGEPGNRLAQTERLLAAAALGVPPEALPQPGGERAPVEKARKPRFALGVVLFFLLIAGGLGWFAYYSNEQRLAAQAARQRSDEVIVFLQRSIRSKLAPLGQLSLLAEVNERIIEHLGRVARETSDPIALTGLADAFRDSAEILEERENHAGALESAIQAVQTRQRVADSPNAPADTALQLIADQRLVAQIYMRMGQAREALAVAEQSRATATALSRKRLGDEQAELALAQAHAQAGDALLELAKLEEAERAFTAGREVARQLAARHPRDTTTQQELAAMAERIARLKERQGDMLAAITELKEWQRILAANAAAAPNDIPARSAVAAAQMRLGNVFLVQRQAADAAAEFRKSAEILEQIARSQSDNPAAQMSYVTALNRLGISLAYDPAAQTEALTVLQRALDHLDRVFPGDADVKATIARSEIQRLRDSVATRR